MSTFYKTLTYPLRDRGGFDVLLVGGGLHLAAVWLPFLPFIAVLGYLARVLDATASAGRLSEAALPGWRPVVPLLGDGVRLLMTSVAYLAIPVVLLTVTLGGPLERIDPTGTGDGVILLVGSTVVLVVSLALVYPLPAALTAVAVDGRLGAAVDRRRLGVATRDGRYLFAFICGGTALLAVSGVYGALNRVALGFFLAFYVEVIVAAALGVAAGNAWDRVGVSPTAAATE